MSSITISGPEGLTAEQIELLKNTICKGSTDDELNLFIYICNKTGLDPFVKQIYSIKRVSNENGKWVETMQPMVSIDGLRLVAERTKCYAPGREPSYCYEKPGEILSATAYVKKRSLDGTWHEVAATAFFKEYAQKTKAGAYTKFWSEKPHIMLAKCAESLALRRAFPADLSGVYGEEEMGVSLGELEVEEKPKDPPKIPDKRLGKGENQDPLLPSPEEMAHYHELLSKMPKDKMGNVESFIRSMGVDSAEKMSAYDLSRLKKSIIKNTPTEAIEEEVPF